MGPIVDLSFAHIKKEVVLGCVDDAGNLFVYRILEQSAGKSSIVDPDPVWIRIQRGFRIRIQEGKSDPQK
jgi:hypothetical protein